MRVMSQKCVHVALFGLSVTSLRSQRGHKVTASLCLLTVASRWSCWNLLTKIMMVKISTYDIQSKMTDCLHWVKAAVAFIQKLSVCALLMRKLDN